MRQAAPERLAAVSGSELVITHLGGQRRDGSRFVTSQLLAAGSGAARDADGVDVIETDAANCMNVSAEALMLEAPVRVHCTALHRGSGGRGTFRRGLDGVYEYDLLEGEAVLTYRGQRHFCPAQGYAGGSGWGTPAEWQTARRQAMWIMGRPFRYSHESSNPPFVPATDGSRS